MTTVEVISRLIHLIRLGPSNGFVVGLAVVDLRVPNRHFLRRPLVLGLAWSFGLLTAAFAQSQDDRAVYEQARLLVASGDPNDYPTAIALFQQVAQGQSRFAPWARVGLTDVAVTQAERQPDRMVETLANAIEEYAQLAKSGPDEPQLQTHLLHNLAVAKARLAGFRPRSGAADSELRKSRAKAPRAKQETLDRSVAMATTPGQSSSVASPREDGGSLGRSEQKQNQDAGLVSRAADGMALRDPGPSSRVQSREELAQAIARIRSEQQHRQLPMPPRPFRPGDH